MHGDHIHQSHPDLVKRLKRANGHLQNVIEMMTNGRECVDVAQQLHAVEKAIGAAKRVLIHDHLDHCIAHVGDKPGDVGTAIAQFKDMTKYL